MKKYIPSNQEKNNIDWSKRMWVKYDDMIVLTTGEHYETGFVGTCMPCNNYPNGEYCTEWGKSQFTPVFGTIMFPISNED